MVEFKHYVAPYLFTDQEISDCFARSLDFAGDVEIPLLATFKVYKDPCHFDAYYVRVSDLAKVVFRDGQAVAYLDCWEHCERHRFKVDDEVCEVMNIWNMQVYAVCIVAAIQIAFDLRIEK